jgi:hypothetical protein
MRQHIQRLFGGQYPVLDARDTAIQFAVGRADWEHGVRNDPNNCAIALAAKRALKPLFKGMNRLAQKGGVQVMKQIAYVPSRDRAGRPVILRYRLYVDVHTRWDRTGRYPSEPIVVTLHPPTRSQQIEVKRRNTLQYRKRIRSGEHQPQRREHPPKPGSQVFAARGNLINHHSCVYED